MLSNLPTGTPELAPPLPLGVSIELYRGQDLGAILDYQRKALREALGPNDFDRGAAGAEAALKRGDAFVAVMGQEVLGFRAFDRASSDAQAKKEITEQLTRWIQLLEGSLYPGGASAERLAGFRDLRVSTGLERCVACRSLVVHPRLQRQGVAQALIDASDRYLSTRRAQYIFTLAAEGQFSAAVFQKCGYVPVRSWKPCYESGLGATLMIRKLA